MVYDGKPKELNVNVNKDFNEKGYLGEQIVEFTRSVETKYPKFFNTAYKINEVTQRLKSDFAIHNEDPQEVLSACLFLRILNGIQAVVILCKLGLVFDTKVILRSIIEGHFLLKAVCEDLEFAKKYVLTDKSRRLKWMNIAKNTKDPYLESAREYATKERMEELNKEIANDKITDISIEELARIAGMESTYNTAYRLLSEEVHCLPRSLEHYLGINAEGKITDFPWGPSDDDIPLILFTSIDTLFNALQLMTKLFSIEMPTELREFDQTLTDLVSKIE